MNYTNVPYYIDYKEKLYPGFQTVGFAAQFAIPFAKYYCHGVGYDIGCNREEWKYPGAIPIDPVLNPNTDALSLPDGLVDYIFSSHCLEHLPNWVDALNHWIEHLKPNGVLFLYLPHEDQEYWNPWNNRKHIHIFNPNTITRFLKSHPQIRKQSIFASDRDLNHSFMVIAQKSSL